MFSGGFLRRILLIWVNVINMQADRLPGKPEESWKSRRVQEIFENSRRNWGKWLDVIVYLWRLNCSLWQQAFQRLPKIEFLKEIAVCKQCGLVNQVFSSLWYWGKITVKDHGCSYCLVSKFWMLWPGTFPIYVTDTSSEYLGQRSYIKVIRSRSRSQEQKVCFCVLFGLLSFESRNLESLF